MKNVSMIAMIAAIGLGSISPAFAQTAGQGPAMGHGGMPTFEELDTNADGGVTLAELEAGFAARFAAHDTNGDGELDTDEIVAMIVAGAADRMAMMQEHTEMQGSNGHGEGNNRRAPNPERMAERIADRAPDMAAKMIERMDRDGNGTLSVSEMRPANLSDMFARIDTDDDGSISAWEMEQAREMMGQRGGRGMHGGGRDGGHGGHGGHGN